MIDTASQTWATVDAWAKEQLDECRKLLERDGTPWERVVGLREVIKRIEKLRKLGEARETHE